MIRYVLLKKEYKHYHKYTIDYIYEETKVRFIIFICYQQPLIKFQKKSFAAQLI